MEEMEIFKEKYKTANDTGRNRKIKYLKETDSEGRNKSSLKNNQALGETGEWDEEYTYHDEH